MIRSQWAFVVLLGCIPAPFLWGQEAKKPSNLDQIMNLDSAPCGNPIKESQLWSVVSGKVTKVESGAKLVVQMSDNRNVTIKLVGLEIKPAHKKAAQNYLEKIALNTKIEAIVNCNWEYQKVKPKKIKGVVLVRQGDANLELIQLGLAQFKKPKPYEMSQVTECEYQKAEKEAKEAR